MANKLLRILEDADAVSYIPVPVGQDILDKHKGIKQYVSYMLDRTNTMFEWDGLPDTIPSYMLELYLQIFGYAAFCSVDSTNAIEQSPNPVVTVPTGTYIFYGGIGGIQDIYLRPKLFTAANPRLKKSIQSTILYPGDDPETPNSCVIMPNDHNYSGLLPLFNRYAQQLVENDISIRSAQINARAQVGISCTTDRDKETARKYLDDLEAGKLGIIGESAFLEGVQVANVSTQSANVIIQLIELQQYLKASWYNELGLNVNFNMKREYMSEEEIAVNTDILLPLVDDMLRCRQEYAELVNKVFGLNISVRKSSAWANKEQEELAGLAEQSAAGGIPLADTISDRIGGESNDAEVQTPLQSEVQSTELGQDQNPEQPQEAQEAPQSVGGEQADVTVNVNINVNGGEVDGDDSVSESETLEESEERDTESGDS